MKILITGGGSEEPIDNVRCVSNFSTGRTASYLADYFCKKGNEVTVVMSEKAKMPLSEKIKTIRYMGFSDLYKILESETKNAYDVIIHAAAVSDYSPKTVEVDGKIFKAGGTEKLPAGKELVIHMKKNPKIIDKLKMWSDKKSILIGFKLTSNADIEAKKTAVQKIFDASEDKNLVPDYIVSNDKMEFKLDKHPYLIFNRNCECVEEGENLQEMAESIEKLI